MSTVNLKEKAGRGEMRMVKGPGVELAVVVVVKPRKKDGPWWAEGGRNRGWTEPTNAATICRVDIEIEYIAKN